MSYYYSEVWRNLQVVKVATIHEVKSRTRPQIHVEQSFEPNSGL